MAEAWPSLARLGVKVVIRREDEHSTAAEAQAVTAAGMNYFNVPIKGVVAPARRSRALASGTTDGMPKRALNEAKSLGMGWTQLGLKHIMMFQPAL